MSRVGRRSTVAQHAPLASAELDTTAVADEQPESTFEAHAGSKPALPATARVTAVERALGGADLSAWKLDSGFEPALAPRSPARDDLPRSWSAAEPVPLSVVMSDLLRLPLPPVRKDGDLEPLIAALGLSPQGPLATKLGHVRSHPVALFGGLEVREPETFPLLAAFLKREGQGQLVSRYLVADLLCQVAAGPGGVIDLAGSALDPAMAADVSMLVARLAALPKGPRIKQHEDVPFDLQMLSSGLFPKLANTAVAEVQTHLDAVEMPLCDWVEANRPATDEDDFVAMRHHLLESNLVLAQKLGAMLIGKHYSSYAAALLHQTTTVPWRAETATMEMVVAEPDPVVAHPRAAITQWDGAAQLGAETIEVLRRAARVGSERIRFIDEGAEALLRLNRLAKNPDDPAFAPQAPRGAEATLVDPPRWFGFASHEAFVAALGGVEGTRDGARQLHGADLQFPVINMAESIIKLDVVGVFISWSVVEDAIRCVRDLERQGLPPRRKFLLAGYGSTGRAIAPMLKAMGYEVMVREVRDPVSGRPSANAELAARELGEDAVCYEVPEDGGGIDAVIGCVGFPWALPGELERLQSTTLLISASSSTKEYAFTAEAGWVADSREEIAANGGAVEFGGQQLVVGNPGPDTRHVHLPIRRPGQELLLINSETPVNLTGGRDPIEPLFAQLIRAQMLLAKRQLETLPPGTKGLIELDRAGQLGLLDLFVKEVAKASPPLPPLVRQLLDEQIALARAKLTGPAAQ